MAKSYWLTITNATEIANTIAQINSEQSALLTALGLTLTATSGTYIFSKGGSQDGGFMVVGSSIVGFSVTTYAGGGTAGAEVVTSYTGGETYHNIICTENSIMLTANPDSKTPTSSVDLYVIITKCEDGSVCVIANGNTRPGNYAIAIIDRYDYTTSNTPALSQRGMGTYSVGIDQFVLAQMPRSTAGKVCENAFLALSRNASVPSSLITMNSVDYAIATTNDAIVACK